MAFERAEDDRQTFHPCERYGMAASGLKKGSRLVGM